MFYSGYPLLFVGLLQVIVIPWIYGIKYKNFISYKFGYIKALNN